MAGLEFALDMLTSGKGTIDPYPLFQPTTPEAYPVPGTYRLQVWKSGATELEFETTFWVTEGWPKEQVVELVRPREELLRETLEIELGTYELPHDKRRLIVLPFRVLPRFVTLGEFQEFRSSSLANRAGDPPGTPAFVDLRSAMAYAHWVGGRLPLAAELLRAEADGALVLQGDGFLGGEYVLDISSGGRPTSHSYLRYGPLQGSPDPFALGQVVFDEKTFSVSLDGGTTRRQVAFRILFPAGAPELHRRLSAEPFDELK